ncbi:hypothetical protein KUTeg_019908 [Tegillarca granosa]|uniref:ubiquitinyl hydrolase 1 n=1 Tax=Tegillarca granosa TaxID=220873 RepID=A0ABQ9EHV7_TEGGR|nr:hypothetical protein KUTeg_019908 [Tegillarca granosa]
MSDHQNDVITREDNYFILITAKLGKKKERSILRTSTKTEVLPGSLLIFCFEKDESSSYSSNPRIVWVLETLEPENIEIECSLDDIRKLDHRTLALLQPIPVCNERLTVFSNKEWLKEGVELTEGDADNHGKGTCDGTFRKKKYFTCEHNSGVFVPLHKIRRDNSVQHRKRVNAANIREHQQKLSNNDQATNWTLPTQQQQQPAIQSDLQEGDRVMWLSDQTGPEFGIVKWIGILPDSTKRDVTVGVEFDNPVGSGTGKYRSHRLFHAKPQHASLVPILGLMKAEEFLSTQAAGSNLHTDEYISNGNQPASKEILKEQEKLWEQAQQRKISSKVETPIQSFPQFKDDKNLPKFPVKKFSSVIPMEATDDRKDQQWAKKEELNPLYNYEEKPFPVSREMSPVKESQVVQRYEEVKKDSFEQPSSRKNMYSRSIPDADPDLEVGSMVEVMSNPPLYGVVRWIGYLPDQKEPLKYIAGLEMEEEISAGTDGTFGSHRMFSCPPRKGFFVPLYKCRKDKRFCEMGYKSGNNFGSMETPDVDGNISPPDSLDLKQISEKVCGKQRGIQGHHNSCYLDATLFSMFYFVTVFDGILYRPSGPDDIGAYDEVKQVIKEGIVNPLRKYANYIYPFVLGYHYVRADKVMKLRHLLDKLGNIPGMMNEEKDPEEFLNLSNGGQEIQHAYFYQLIMEKDERLRPSCLIIQMPRFGKNYKMYKRIVPSMELDITDVLETAPRECIICGDLAMFECRQCYQVHGAGLNTIAFCDSCKDTSHLHKSRKNHDPQPIHVPQEYINYHAQQKQITGQIPAIQRDKMELFAVVCIQTSHYVAFVKCGRGKKAPWVFFDSMADRMGEQSGYNIPEVQLCEELSTWLSDEYHEQILRRTDDKDLPEHMRRLLCDAYMCMYYNPEVAMFK